MYVGLSAEDEGEKIVFIYSAYGGLPFAKSARLS
jgi:hypothetical protein